MALEVLRTNLLRRPLRGHPESPRIGCACIFRSFRKVKAHFWTCERPPDTVFPVRKASSSSAQGAERPAKGAAASAETRGARSRDAFGREPSGRSRTKGSASLVADGPPKRGEKRERSAAKSGRPRATAPRPHTTLSVEDILQRAIAATTSRTRRLWARRGLTLRGANDRTLRALLLRQLYLSFFEERRFDKAAPISEQMVLLEVLPDVAHQDAARAKQALGDIDGAASHLRLAARVGPPNRRAFHFWSLGSLYFVAGRYTDAISALTRAARWGTTDKPLYQAHLALAQCESGQTVDDLDGVIARLAEAPSAQGYGRFILGHLLRYAGRRAEARRHLEAFVKRTTSGRVALAVALEAEVARARDTLSTLSGSA